MRTTKAVKGGANPFDLKGRVAVITGGAGLLGEQHAVAIHRFGGIPVLADVDLGLARAVARRVGRRAVAVQIDVTSEASIRGVLEELVERFGGVDILVNNAARNPKVEKSATGAMLGRLERLDIGALEKDIAVGLTGAVLCSSVFGEHMASRGRGVILNIASDLGVIGPDQRLYRKAGVPEGEQPKKPVSYSVVKAGLIGLTRYLATYWADRGVRANAICPGGVENGQPQEFLDRIAKLIPMGRMARVDEYQGAVVFLCSDASSYVTGSVLSADGGRTAW